MEQRLTDDELTDLENLTAAGQLLGKSRLVLAMIAELRERRAPITAIFMTLILLATKCIDGPAAVATP